MWAHDILQSEKGGYGYLRTPLTKDRTLYKDIVRLDYKTSGNTLIR